MTRVISGVVLAAAALAAIVFLPTPALGVLASAIAARAAYEYSRIVGLPPVETWMVVMAVAAACWLASSAFRVDPVFAAAVVLGWILIDVVFLGRTLHQASSALVALVYVGVPIGLLVAIHRQQGWAAPLLLIATIAVSDSAQYYSGRAFGRRPLAPKISPKKTMEGAVGGVLIGTAFMALAWTTALPTTNAVSPVLVGLTVVVLGICGDLFESRLKRDAGMKDSGTLIPGHGGVLDRIDALLLASPAFFLFLNGRA